MVLDSRSRVDGAEVLNGNGTKPTVPVMALAMATIRA